MLGVRRRRLEDKIGGRTFLGFFFGPRSKAAVALRSPLSRVRVIRVFDGGGGGERTKGRKGGYKGKWTGQRIPSSGGSSA